MNNEERLAKLESQVRELLAWKEQRARQQITFPLDETSREVLSKDFLSYISNLDFTSASGLIFPNILVGYNGVRSLIAVTNNLNQFTAATSDLITLNNPNAFYENDDQVVFYTTDTLPAPLVDSSPYFIINASANTFKVSLTSGGAAVNITDTGVGAHFVAFFT